MGLITWLTERLLNGQPVETEITNEEFFNLQAELYVRNLAFQSAVNLISNAISKCEFKTFFKNEETRGDEYYLFNYEPNQNQNSSEFIHQMVNKLYRNNEVLIISQKDKLYVAESYQKKESAFYDYQFTDVHVDGLTLNKKFFMSDVIFLRLQDENIRRLINGMYETYGKLISYGQQTYQRSRGRRGILKISATATNDPDFKDKFEKLMNERFKKYFEANNAVLPLFNGYDYDEQGSKTYSNETTRDIKAMVDDIYDFTARAFLIPPVLLKGDTAGNKDVVTSFLTFCIDPLADMIEEEVTRKRCGKNGFKQGTFLLIDTSCVKHVDLFDISSGAEKLIGSGMASINELREAIDRPRINEAWADKHFMTKNFADITELLKQLLGDSGGDDG